MHDLSFEFFYWFSRFEFALRNEYLKSRKLGARAEASWVLFTERHENGYVASNAARALISAAPQRQVVGHGGLEFTPVPFSVTDSELKKVVTLSQAVKNNLFHGGKRGHDTWDDPDRVRMLLPLVVEVLGELAEFTGIEADYFRSYWRLLRSTEFVGSTPPTRR